MPPSLEDRLTRLEARLRRERLVLLVALALVPASLFAGPYVVPHVFSNGAVADADAVNENFSGLAGAVDSLTATSVDLSDLQVFENATTSGNVTLVDVTGPGQLLGGQVFGYYPRSVSSSSNYRVDLTIDGVNRLYPATSAYSQAASGGNESAIVLPPVRFSKSLRIRYNVPDTNRVYGVAFVKQPR